MTQLSIHPLGGIPEVGPGDPLAELIHNALRRDRLQLQASDVVVVTQKIVSKAEGRLLSLREVMPSERAITLAREVQFDPRHVEVILRESVRLIRQAPRVLITETRQGLVCANSGVDRSNAGGVEQVVLLPEDPDRSAADLRTALARLTGVSVGIVISDSFGRPWREGQVNVAIGAAGITALRDYRGQTDPEGYELQGSVLGVADELASAAELVMGKLDRVPGALIRGAALTGDENARVLLRDPSTDLFR